MPNPTHCKLCDEVFNSQRPLILHIKKEHGIVYEDYIIEHCYGGIRPTCQCGCGTEMTFESHSSPNFYKKYTKNHFPRLPHTEETKRKIGQTSMATFMDRYGVSNAMQVKKFVDEIGNTKFHRFGNAKYNNADKMRETNRERYGVEYFTESEPFKARDKKTSKIEGVVCKLLGGEGKFRFDGREYDIRVGNYLIEVDGDYFHPTHLSEMNLLQFNSAVNDYRKTKAVEGSEFELVRIKVSMLKNKMGQLNLDFILENRYVQDFGWNRWTVFLTKEVISKYVSSGKSVDKLVKMMGTFLHTICSVIVEPEPTHQLILNGLDFSLDNLRVQN